MMPMANEEIAAVLDPAKRARLELLRDLVHELDQMASDHRGATKNRSGRAGAEALLDNIQAAIADERAKGIIAAAEVVVRKFRDEADTVPANMPTGEPDGQTRRDQVE